ncbi:MAG: MerR family transcriptional regulator [Saccharofermentanales bacterium]
MEYTIKKLADLAGISSRTLRYYDEIGLLCPARISSSGYRIYGSREVNRLQQILFYREFDLPLVQIAEIIDNEQFSPLAALRGHRLQLLAQRKRLDTLITNLDKSLAAMEGKLTMQDKDKFEGFKKELIDQNEEKYGAEAREKYGDAEVDRSNAKLMGLTEVQYAEEIRLSQELTETLTAAVQAGADPGGELGQKAASLHRDWLTCFWPEYSPEAHAALAQMYVDDPRFTAYYDKEQPGSAVFLRDAIKIYTR